MYEVLRLRGKTTGVTRLSDGAIIPLDSRNKDFAQFLTWNAQQAAPLDLSDQAPPPPEPDSELDQISAILDKTDADVTAAEVRALVLRVARRLRKRGQL